MKAGDSLFAATDVTAARDGGPGGLHVDQSWLCAGSATTLLRQLLNESAWQREEIVLYGRRIAVPRLTAWHGDFGLNYRYSGVDHPASGWSETLVELRDRLSEVCQQPFNYVLLNRYRDGRDYMGWHSDDEANVRGGIAALSLGQERRFAVRAKPGWDGAGGKGKPGPISSVNLAHGSLLFMPPGYQQRFLHALPKASSKSTNTAQSQLSCLSDQDFSADRVSLTFRWLASE